MDAKVEEFLGKFYAHIYLAMCAEFLVKNAQGEMELPEGVEPIDAADIPLFCQVREQAMNNAKKMFKPHHQPPL